MPDSSRLTLPECDISTTRHEIRASIESWARADELLELVDRFGGDIGEATSLESWLEALVEFSSRHWDFRAGRERHQAERVRFTPDTEAAILRAASALGLRRDSWPRFGRYDHVLVLGGLIGACLARTWYAAHLIDSGVTADDVTAIGGFRVMDTAEQELAAGHGIDACRYEIDALATGLARAFDVDEPIKVVAGPDPSADPHRSWSVIEFEADRLRAVAAPSSRPEERRADTADTMRFWADEVARLRQGSRILVVTSAQFVPFQHFDAIHVLGLPYGCSIDTVGVQQARLPNRLVPKKIPPDRYLQELRSTLRSMRRLLTGSTG